MNTRKNLLIGFLLLALCLSIAANIQLGAFAASQDLPRLEVSKSVSPEEVKLGETGSPLEMATVTLAIKGVGEPVGEGFPVDVILVVDRSRSMSEQNRLEDAVSAAYIFIDQLDIDKDRFGLVSFAPSASLDVGLTSNITMVKKALTGLTATGHTAIGDALQLATEELTSNGRLEAVWVEVLLSDGVVSVGSDPVKRAEEAAKEDITVYTIGIRPPNEEALSTLYKVANMTGGRYYSIPEPHAMEEIYNLAQRVITLAGSEIVVREVLPEHIHLVGNYSVKPTNISTNPDGTTVVEWNVGFLSLGDVWSVSFDVTSTSSGHIPVDVYGAAMVSYKDYRGALMTVNFPKAELKVNPNQLPVAGAGADREVEQTGSRGALVTLDGSASYDPDGDKLTYTWRWSGGSASGVRSWAMLPVGDNVVTLTVDDGIGKASDTVKVVVLESSFPFSTPSEGEADSVIGYIAIKFVPYYFLYAKEILILPVLALLVAMLALLTRGEEGRRKWGEEYERLRRQLRLHKILIRFLYLLLAIMLVVLFVIPFFI